jgi:hypothetical protein
MIPLISNAIALHFKETADVELRFNHRQSNAYRTQVYDVYVGDYVLLSSLRIPEMIIDFRKETRWADDRIQEEMTAILIGYIINAMNLDKAAEESQSDENV